MKFIKYIFISLGAIFITGCTLHQSIPVANLVNDFNSIKAKALLKKGNNTIKGSALIRQNGGGIVTCAGNKVYLTPFTKYAEERINILYGFRDKGYNSYGYGGKRVKFVPDNSEYVQLTKETICDTQGYFQFDNISDGTFYITTSVYWTVGYSKQGGWLMQKVSIKNGELKRIVLTP